MGSRARQAGRHTRVVEFIAAQLAAIPGVVAVTLGGSRATNTAVEGSDWDFGLYYRGRLDPADVVALGWPGRVFAPGEWGRVINGGAWLTINGTKVDLIYRDLDEVLRWTAAAEDGQFEIHPQIGYVAGIATYVLAGELALGKVLAGELPRPRFPPKLRETAPAAWSRLAAGALHFAAVHGGREDTAACLANLCQAVLAAAQGRLVAAGEWVLNEKRLVQRAGLGSVQKRLNQPGRDLGPLVRDVGALLAVSDAVWVDG
jgi:predicted nucleotidyltransferase